MIDLICLAYTAGILDGEGSIQINPTRGANGRYYFGLTIQISGNEGDVLKKLRREWGNIGKISEWKPRGAKGGRSGYNWRMYGREAQKFIGVLLPYLRMKKDRAEVALEFMKYVKFRGEKGTKKYLTEEQKDGRFRLANKMRELNSKNGKGTNKFVLRKEC